MTDLEQGQLKIFVDYRMRQIEARMSRAIPDDFPDVAHEMFLMIYQQHRQGMTLLGKMQVRKYLPFAHPASQQAYLDEAVRRGYLEYTYGDHGGGRLKVRMTALLLAHMEHRLKLEIHDLLKVAATLRRKP